MTAARRAATRGHVSPAKRPARAAPRFASAGNMGGALQRQIQASWAAGMYRSSSPELIPNDGAYDLTNCTLDLLGGVGKRGGSVYRSTAAFGTGIRWLWDGALTNGGKQTLLASPTAFGRLEGSGVVTSLGEGGLSAPAKPAVFQGKIYFPGSGKIFDGTTWTLMSIPPALVGRGTSLAVVANRVVVGEGARVAFTGVPRKPGEGVTFAETDYHELPEGAQILGIAGGRDACVVFTTAGVWVISNMALNLTDAAGNVQQRLDHYSGELILWGEAGIAAWEGSLIVPAVDAVWLVKRGITSESVVSFERLSDPIRDLYQQYVAMGYTPGGGCVFNNHYLLPIIGGGRVVDVLVCRLDMPAATGRSPYAWTHFTGFGAEVGALCARVSGPSSAREPELIGGVYGENARVLTCSYFNAVAGTGKDADGSAPEWAVGTRSYETGSLVPNLVSRIRARYQLIKEGAGPGIVAEEVEPVNVSTSGAIWGLFVWGVGKWATAGNEPREALAGEGGEDAEASKPHTWNVIRKRRFIRFRLSCKAATAQLSLKSLELFTRPQGRV